MTMKVEDGCGAGASAGWVPVPLLDRWVPLMGGWVPLLEGWVPVLSPDLTCPSSCCSNSCSHIPPTCDAMHDSAVHRSLDFHKWGASTCCCCCRRVHTRPGNGSFRDLWSCLSTVCRVSFCAGRIFGCAMKYAVFVANTFFCTEPINAVLRYLNS